jgi:hypothetical protein
MRDGKIAGAAQGPETSLLSQNFSQNSEGGNPNRQGHTGLH